MKIGTVLKNTSVNEHHPLYLTVYTGQSNGKATVIYPYSDGSGVNNGHYLLSDIGKDKSIIPIGHIDLVKVLKDEINKIIKENNYEN